MEAVEQIEVHNDRVSVVISPSLSPPFPPATTLPVNRWNELQTQEELEQSNEKLLWTICGKPHLGGAAKCWQNEFQTHEEQPVSSTQCSQQSSTKAARKAARTGASKAASKATSSRVLSHISNFSATYILASEDLSSSRSQSHHL